MIAAEGVSLFIVDDDPSVRTSLTRLLRAEGVEPLCFATAEEFLDHLPAVNGPGCALLDIGLPGRSGLELHARLQATRPEVPVIFLTGHGDVPMAVQALKDGAFDFVEKPYDDNALVDKVLSAFAHDEKRGARDSAVLLVRSRLAQLTHREQQVMSLILAGKLNKVIADELSIAMRTVEVHRSHIFEKMQVRSAVELSQALALLGEFPNA